ncbi:MAG: hypothetical protein ACT4PG_01395 [Panacagrimonas sp.]
MDDEVRQQLLALGDITAAAAAVSDAPDKAGDVASEEPSLRSVRPARRAPRAFPEHLPRETVIHQAPSCDCPDCGAQMRTPSRAACRHRDCSRR